MKKLFDEWAEIAEGDYEAATVLFETHWPRQYIRICYNCQQSAEKYLKGYLAYNGEPIVKTHIIGELIDLCAKYDADFETIRKIGDFLTPFAVQVRYPNNTYTITDIETKKALDHAKKIQEFVIIKIKSID